MRAISFVCLKLRISKPPPGCLRCRGQGFVDRPVHIRPRFIAQPVAGPTAVEILQAHMFLCRPVSSCARSEKLEEKTDLSLISRVREEYRLCGCEVPRYRRRPRFHLLSLLGENIPVTLRWTP